MVALRRRAHALYVVGVTAIAVGLAAGALIGVGTNSETVTCAAFPACLSSPTTWIGAIHVIAAGLLLLLAVAMIGLAWGLRREPGHALGASIGAWVVLVGMASIGAGLASGAVPLGFSAIQFVFLAVLLALVAVAARDGRRIRRAPLPATGRPFP